MQNTSEAQEGVETAASAETKDGISRRRAMTVMAKYGAATAPVMVTLFHGAHTSARAAGSGDVVREEA